MTKPARCTATSITTSQMAAATRRSMRSHKRLRTRLDERATVRCPAAGEGLDDARPTVPAPPPSLGETSRPSPVPKRSSVVPGRSDGLAPAAMFVLGLVDGYTPLDDVIAASGLDERDALRFLADLVAQGLVVVA